MKDNPKRATLFETTADQYDMYRPGYSSILIEEMLTLSGITSTGKLLEVGCGTGKATVMVAKEGNPIDCIEPGENLVAIAKQNCKAWPNVKFIIGKFEDVSLTANHYDLVFSAQAFHWIDERTRWTLCKQCLVKSGSVAIIHNYPIPSQDSVGKSLTHLIDHESGGMMKTSDHKESINKWIEEMVGTALFHPVQVRRYKWTKRCSPEGYIGLFGTYSDFLSLSPTARSRISEGILEILTKNGGFFDQNYESVLLHARLSTREET